ncbi:MAG: toll/interleukin-1 receptor domain-containing protein [Cyanobium sp.]
MPEISSLRLFISYSHKDESLRLSLGDHLAALKREGVIETWHDRLISAGQEWIDEIRAELEAADIILCLVSAGFLASPYCQDKELKRALERHEAGEALVIPVILKPSDWSSSALGRLQALPANAKPVTKWNNRDEASPRWPRASARQQSSCNSARRCRRPSRGRLHAPAPPLPQAPAHWKTLKAR